jgi:deoxycytidylate deaminase
MGKFLITKSWIRGFQAAKAASIHSNTNRVSRRIGAALFSKSNLIAVGFNIYGTTHPDSDHIRASLHAEHKAILKRQHFDDNSGLVVYIYRELANGNPACSKPCSNCQNILREAGISKVRFIELNGIYSEMSL